MNKQNKKIRIAMAGGGTGGHVFPIKSLIQYFSIQEQWKQKVDTIYWIGKTHALEHKVAQELHIPFLSIFSGKLRRESQLQAKIKNIRDLFLFGIGIIQSFWYIKRHKIDVIFCKGGYVALPMVIAGYLLKKKIVVHESDTHSGLVNRIASKLADKTFTGFTGALEDSQTIGQILSDDIIFVPEKSTNIIPKEWDMSKPVCIVTGGSQGAQKMYQSLLKALETDKSIQNDMYFYIVLGLLNKDMREYFEKYPNVRCLDFASQQQMGELYWYGDIAITRAGTTSLAEQKLYDMKIIMIPIPWTHDQYDNARWYEKHEQDILIDQKQDGFLNKFIMEIKRHKNFKKNLVAKDRLATIRQAKITIWEVLLKGE